MSTLNPFIGYLLKVGISLAFLYLFYMLLLRRLTFYRLNRWFLLTYSALAFILPLLDINILFPANRIATIPVLGTVPSVNEFWYTGAIENTGITSPLSDPTTNVSWQSIISIIFIAGIVVMTIRFFVQLFILYRIRRKATFSAGYGANIFKVDDTIAPFSFINRIYINHELHSAEELNEIIAHERTHIEQKHYIDILFIQLMGIIQWFNPFVWLLTKMMRENLEFLADKAVLNEGMDARHYQYHLLKITGAHVSALSNQFNFSSLKTRIIMMNKKQTPKVQLARLLIVLPFTLLILTAFRSPKLNIKKENTSANSISVSLITPPGDTTKKPPLVSGWTPYLEPGSGATKEEIDEYNAIVKEIDSGNPKRSAFMYENEVKPKLEQIYKHMTTEQRKNIQIFFARASRPPEKKVPTKKQLEEWKDEKGYGVRINSRKIKNSELEKHRPSEFSFYSVSNFYGGAKSNVIYNQQVNIITNDQYEYWVKKYNPNATVMIYSTRKVPTK